VTSPRLVFLNGRGIAGLCFLLLGWVADASAGPGPLPMENIRVGGVTRAFDVYRPDGLVRGRPVVVALHGHGGTSCSMSGACIRTSPWSIWQELAHHHGFLVVYPQGVRGPDGQPGWNDCRADNQRNPDSDDLAFMAAIQEWAQSKHGSDPQRMYAAGVSNGGHMAMRLALEHPERWAAIAVVAASVPRHRKSPGCVGPAKVPAAFWLGDKDPVSPFEGGYVGGRKGGEVLSADASVAWWGGSSDSSKTQPVPDVRDDDGGRMVRYAYPAHPGRPQVLLYRAFGGGHATPSRRARYRAWMEVTLGKQNGDVEFAEESWAFFQAHRAHSVSDPSIPP
jgi:polyhydroxybutyrate depolymerase